MDGDADGEDHAPPATGVTSPTVAGAPPLARTVFDERRRRLRQVVREEGRRLAFVSVGLGAGQLLFIRWADRHMLPGPRLVTTGILFLAYLALVVSLLWRREHRLRSARLRCPQCGTSLADLAERIAAATGRCDECGGSVVEPRILSL